MMRFIIGAVLLAGAVVFLTSCETLSKDECVAADWRVIGEQDGSEGYDPQQRFGGHVKACKRAGIVPNQALWNEGYQAGLYKFCTPTRGLSYGQAGNVYQNVCPPNLDPGFKSGYQLGREEWQAKSDITNIENRIKAAETNISTTRNRISKGKINQREGRRSIRRSRDEIRDLNYELGRAEADLGSVQRRVELFLQDPNATRVYN